MEMSDIWGYFKDFSESEDQPKQDKQSSDNIPDDYIIKDYTKLYKIPKYLEAV